jgi:hypothetical protein
MAISHSYFRVFTPSKTFAIIVSELNEMSKSILKSNVVCGRVVMNSTIRATAEELVELTGGCHKS